jgi:tetratricopeptide (TPR) repeat protein
MDMVPSRARRHRWPVVAVVMIGIAAVGWLLWPAPRDALPAGAWAAFLNAEFSTVTRMARSAQARGQSTEGLRLLHGLTLVVENRASATTVLEDAARASADSASRSAQLIRLAVGMTTREDASRAALETFIAAHPDEPTARILGCTYDLRAGEPHCERLEALLPGTAVAALVRGLHASRTARWRTARQIAQDALRHHPQTPALLLLEAESHVFLGDFERARTALTALLRREPGLMMARRRLLTALISLGLDADAARELARFEDDTTDPRHRLGMLYEAGRDHAGLGHAARAFAALDRATATARDLLDFGAVSSLCGQRFALARLLGDVARMEAALQCRRAAAGELEISNADRRKAQIANLVLHGELALHRHDLAEAKRTAGRLVGFEGEQAAVDAFRARLAAQEGDLKTADAALANGIDRCATHYNALSIWAQSGHRERALRAGKRLLNTECVMFGSDRIRVANAHLMLAELRAADAPQIALEHLAAWRTLWPSPDATLPAVHRAEAWVKRLTP